MYLTFYIKPNITFYKNDNEYYNYKYIKLNKKLLEYMIKDIESTKFRDWYSSNINETVTQDSENIDNYLNFKITKIEHTNKFVFKCTVKLSINYKGKYYTKKNKKDIDKLINLKNISEYLKSSSSHLFSSRDSFRAELNYSIIDKSNLYKLFKGSYFIQNNKIVKQNIDETKPYESCNFVIKGKNIFKITIN